SDLYVNNSLDRSRREIRVLTVHPICGSSIICSMNSISLDESIPCKALSYVWGDRKVTMSILVNRQTVQVTANLATAHRHLRQASLPPDIWPDAISINQGDAEERGHQVCMMQDIYSCASRVVVFLGKLRMSTKVIRAAQLGYFGDTDMLKAYYEEGQFSERMFSIV
ncbi:hypothetical protein GQ53DRAFT_854949, partial [Thozetella sp. PMI_491]